MIELMRTRRSVRRFKPDALRRDQVEALVEAAITAPSASNKQPWRFFVVTDRARIEALAAAVQQRLDAIVARLDDSAAAQVRDYGRYFVRFVDAPCLIVPVCRTMRVLSHLLPGDAMPADWAADVDTMERHSALVSTSLAVQNLLLAAHAMGLGASALAGPLIAAGPLQAELGIPADWHIVCLVAAGHPDEEPTPPSRKPVDAVIRWIDA